MEINFEITMCWHLIPQVLALWEVSGLDTVIYG